MSKHTWGTITTEVKIDDHSTRHENAGADEINLDGLSGMPADVETELNEKDYGLSFEAPVTTYTDTTHFKVSTLAGKGTGFFKPVAGTPYEIYVVEADGAAPEGEQTPVVAYTTADGTFQHTAFTVPLAVGDIVLIIHPLLASLGTKATAAADGAVTTTDYLMAYIKQLVTELQVVDALVDLIPTTAMRGTDSAMLAVNGALEATLTAIKGGGWSTETLKAIKDLVAAIPTTAMRGTDNALLAADYITERGTDNAALATTLEDAMQKLTTPAYNQDTDSLEALRELLDTIAGYLDSEIAAIPAVDTEVGDILTDTGTTIPGTITTLQNTTNAITAAGPTKAEMDAAHALLATPAQVATAISNYDPPTRAELTTDKDSIITEVNANETKVDTVKAETALIVADTGELQTDWVNGGRLDLLIDAIKAKTDTIVASGALEATLAAIKGGGWATETLVAIKAAIDALSGGGVPTATDWKGSFNWDTSEYTNTEIDISALFSTTLALTTRRKYSVYLDLTNVAADASFVSLYLAVKTKIDGTNYRAIDRKTVLDADIGTTAEPGIIISIPAVAENVQITLQMSTALGADATIYYAVVKEHLE